MMKEDEPEGNKKKKDRRGPKRTIHTISGYRTAKKLWLSVVQFPRTRLMRLAVPQLFDNL